MRNQLAHRPRMKQAARFICSLLWLLAPLTIYSGAQTPNQRRSSTEPELIVQLGQGSSVDDAIFSPDGSSVLTAHFGPSGDAVLWDVASGSEVRRFSGGSEELKAIGFSGDRRFVLTGSYDGVARLWNAATGEQLQAFKAPMGPVLAVAFASDSRYVLTGSQSKYLDGQKVVGDLVRVWDVRTGDPVRSLAVQWPVAFSRDGRFVVTGSESKTARVLDVNTGREIKEFALPDQLGEAQFSADGRVLLTTAMANAYDAAAPRTLILWDFATGKEIRRIEKSKALRPKLSPDGRYLGLSEAEVTISSLNLSTVIIDVTTGHELKRIKNVWAVGFSPDASAVVTADGGNLRFWDVQSGKLIRIFRGYSSTVLSVSLSSDNRYLLSGSGLRAAQLWDLGTGQQIQRYVAEKGSVDYASLSRDHSFVFTQGFDNPGQVWNAITGEPLRKISGHLKMHEEAILSPDGQYIFTGGFDNPARLWDPLTGAEVRRFNGHKGTVRAAAFSPDSKFVVTLNLGEDNLGQWGILWDVATGKEVRRFQVPAQMGLSLTISPDNRFLAVGGFDPAVGRNTYDASPFVRVGGAPPNYNNAYLVDLMTGTVIRSFVGHSNRVGSVTFSPDGRRLLTGSWDNTARLWDVATGRQLRVLKGHSSGVWSAQFSHDGQFVVTGSTDSTARFWHSDDGREICRLISFTNGTWIVVAPDGRFDANNLDQISGLNWIMPDDPFRPIPAEVFMKDYYEPRLLARLLAGEKFSPIKSVTELNRVQPGVSIKEILWDGQGRDKVSITVEVSAASREFLRDGRKVTRETGVYDLRLFRDGQQVGYAPASGGEIKVDPATKKTLVVFPGITLPRRRDLTRVEFSAYAFNVDRVKSATDTKAIQYPTDLGPVKGRAYVIGIGVNAYENAEWNLKYAANDAREVQRTLSEKLSQGGQYQEVVTVSLISDYETREGQNVVTEKMATKATIRAVVDLLAGKSVGPEIVKAIPNVDKLRAATPDDLVIISISSHGYADQKGKFYLIPYDVGVGSKREINVDLLQHCISSDELNLWLRDVDAGELVMIVDACHSAASVQGEGFKPGPMGSRGLGQLAYDKGMRILTSTQSDDVALETDFTRQGLLTYALTHDGIGAGEADFKPRDRVINLAEWLEYAVERVPRLYREIEKTYQTQALDELKSIALGQGSRTKLLIFSRDGNNSSLKKGPHQQPSLFDFTRKKPQVVLARTN